MAKPNKRFGIEGLFLADPKNNENNVTSCTKKPQTVGKENMKKDPTPHPSKFRVRKGSEGGLEHNTRRLALQEIDLTNNDRAVGRRRICSCGDSSAYNKGSIPIYTDEVAKERHYEKRNCIKSAKETILGTRGIAKTVRIPTRATVDSKPTTSPQDLPHIPQVDVTHIKKEYRNQQKTSAVRKRQPPYDVLSVALAYNINYLSEYITFQMNTNQKRRLSSSFLQKNVTADQRRLLASYLIASTSYYEYPSFILYQAIKIFDFYIDCVSVKTNTLQTVALAALWIALKKDLINDEIPEASKIIDLAPSYFKGNKQPLIDYEKKILVSLGFEISFGEPFSMLALYTVLLEEVRVLLPEKVQELYYFGSYMIDLSIMMHNLCNLSAVHLAGICAEIALNLTMSSEEQFRSCKWSYWRNRVLSIHPLIYQYRLTESYMNLVRNQLLQNVVLSTDPQSDFHTVYKKYKTKRYGPISHLLASKVLNL